MSDTQPRTLSRSTDHLDALASALRDLDSPTTILHELVQNADDSGNATTVWFTITDEALTAWNDGDFTDCGDDGKDCSWPTRCDLHAFRRFAGRSKAFDETKTGAFGVGFTSVYRVTDHPELLYGDQHWILDESASEDERMVACDGACGRQHGEAGTRFVLPWARDDSTLRHSLGVQPITDEAITELETTLLGDVAGTAPFLKHVDTIEVVSRTSGSRAHRRELADGIELVDDAGAAKWLTFTGDFGADAARLAATYPGHVSPDRSSTVTVAVPVGPVLATGFLYATLPTETPSGFPGHVNAAFFPHTDRESVVFDGGFGAEWNKAAIRAAAKTLADHVPEIVAQIGIPAFWEFVAAISLQDRRAGQGQQNWASPYLDALRKVVPTLAVIETVGGRAELPRNALVPQDRTLYEGTEAFKAIGLPVVAEDLQRSLLTNGLFTSFGLSQLTKRHILERLSDAGYDSEFQYGVDGRLTRAQLEQILTALTSLPGKLGNIEGVKDVAIAPCRDGYVAPPSWVNWPSAGTEERLSDLFGPEFYFADVETVESSCPELRDECGTLSIDDVAGWLAEADKETLAAFSERLLDWFDERAGEIGLGERPGIAALAIFPTASGTFAPLTTLSLPNEFPDPLGLAALVDRRAALNHHRLLERLGARPLDVVEYFRTHALPAVRDEHISAAQASELLRLVGQHLDDLAQLRDDIAAAPVIPGQDGRLHVAAELHLPSEELALLAPQLPVADTESTSNVVLTWLGVRSSPSDEALRIAALEMPDLRSEAVTPRALAILRVLAARQEALSADARSFLGVQPWLPTRRDTLARPSEILPTNQKHLYGEQGQELGLPAPDQNRYFGQLTALGMPQTPPLSVIVAHLKHCAANAIPMNQAEEVYRALSNNADAPIIRQLRNTACVQVAPGQFMTPSTVFWERVQFGRWGYVLPALWVQFKPFFDVVGVKDEPGPREVAAVLHSILDEFGSDPVDEVGATAVHACWARLSDRLEDAAMAQVLEELGQTRSVIDSRGVLERPDLLFFEDSLGLHKRFHLLANSVIPRTLGAWPALERAGVRRIEAVARAKLIDTETVPDGEMQARIDGRLGALHRVIDDESAFKRLHELRLGRTSSVAIRLEGVFFGYQEYTGVEQSDAIYLWEEHLLVRDESARSMRTFARELVRAIEPDSDPGPIAMKLQPILDAESVEEAHAVLDEFGIARLSLDESEGAWSSEIHPDRLGEQPDLDSFEVAGPSEDGEARAPRVEPPDHEDDVIGSGRPSASDNEASTAAPAVTPQLEVGGVGGAGGVDRSVSTANRPSSRLWHLDDDFADEASVATDASYARSGHASSGRAPGRSSGGRSAPQTRLRSYVLPAGSHESDRDLVGDEAPDNTPVDSAGVSRVVNYEMAHGRTPRVMPHSNPGFDVESFDERGNLVRRIEVKSTADRWSVRGVMLSARQHHQAVEDGALFWLYVVESALDDEDFAVHRIQDPAGRIDYFGFDGDWKRVGEAD